MANEEKAKEIAELHEIIYIANAGEHGSSYLECYSSAMQMAEWKEQQMIEKACEWLERNADKYVASYGFPTYQTGLLIMDFKKAMEKQ